MLALDSAVEEQVAVLRRNLLKLVHLREFATAAEFKVRPYWPHKPSAVSYVEWIVWHLGLTLEVSAASACNMILMPKKAWL